MDTMTVTKVVGGVCSTLLVFLMVKWGAEIVFHGSSHDDVAPAYSLEVADSESIDPGVTGPTFAELLAVADIGKGERVFGKCKACHKIGDGENGTGPTLYQIIDREKGGATGFEYSPAMTAFGGTWTPEELDAFLLKPSDYVPGTSMGFSGLSKPTDRANLIAYLQSL